MSQTVNIYSSKAKGFKLLLLSVILVAMCLLLALVIPDVPTLEKTVGYFGAVFFGIAILISIRMILEKKLVLVVDSVGVNIDPLKSDEKISWSDIQSFGTLKINGTKILMIHVNNPDCFIDKETNMVKRNMMKFNVSNYGAPFSLTSDVMEISHKELLKLLNDSLLKFHSNVPY